MTLHLPNPRNAALLCLVGLAALLLSGCDNRRQPIYDIAERPIAASIQEKLDLDGVRKAIVDAAQTEQWLVEELAPGQLRARRDWRSHSATIDIAYDEDSYSIQLVESANLLQQPDSKIHRKYNQYVMALEREIERALFAAGQ